MLIITDVFGLKHLTGLVFSILLIVLLLVVLKNKKHNSKCVLIFSAILILVLEFTKYSIMILNDNFGLNDLPFQLCSSAIYVMPLIALGNKNINKYALPFAFSIGLLAGGLALLYPSNILGSTEFWFPISGDYLPFISFLYHAYMIFYALYLYQQKLYIPKRKDIFTVFMMLLIAAVFVNVLNFIWDTDFMMLRYASGNPFQFLLQYHYLLFLSSMVFLGIIMITLTYVGFLLKADFDTKNTISK